MSIRLTGDVNDKCEFIPWPRKLLLKNGMDRLKIKPDI